MQVPSEASAIRSFPNVDEVTEILVRQYGRPSLGNRQNPLNELLYIILSSKTPPDRYQEVYRDLRKAYKKADDLAHAHPEEVARTISHGGLQNRKARAIVSIAQELKRGFGRVTLASLAKMTNEEAEQFLTSLPEVSKKTARCVLMYALGRQLFPVDAHCFRIAQRLRWISGSYLTDRRADELQEGIPRPLRRDLHVGMVLLGRHYCVPRNPLCGECPLVKLCPAGIANIGKAAESGA